MEFGLRFELSDNKFMQMKRMLVMSLLCSVVASCASQQVTVTVVSTPTTIFSSNTASNTQPTFTPLPPPMMNDIFTQDNIKELAVYARGRNSADFSSEITSDIVCRHNGKYGLHLTAMPTTDAFYKGYWNIVFDPKPLDVSKFSFLDFWIKGQLDKENLAVHMTASPGADLQVELSNYLEITKEWQLAHIPINSFTQNGLIESGFLKQITSLDFIFNPSNALQEICLDDITFVP